MATEELPRPSFYALTPGGWRDYFTLLHLPYTAWHLSYIVIGAALAPMLDVDRLVATLVAFFLAVGIGAHALDELNGRPLRTRIPTRVLAALAAASIAAAVGIGVAAAVNLNGWLGIFVGLGPFIVIAYNLELFGGWFHSDLWFALMWGGFPLLCGYFALAETIRPEAAFAAAFATGLSLAQRRLSTQVRDVRRRVVHVEGTIERSDGSREPITAESLRSTPERVLELLAVSIVVLACALVITRVT